MESKELFFYELEGRGYIFQNKKWDESKHGFEDDMLNMAWEMWSSAKAQKVAVPEGFKLVPVEPRDSMIADGNYANMLQDGEYFDSSVIYKAMIEAQEQH